MLEPTSFTNPPDLTGECMEWGCHHSEEMHGFEAIAAERVCRRCKGKGVTPLTFGPTEMILGDKSVLIESATCWFCEGKGHYASSAWVPKCRTEGCTCQGFSDVDTSEDPRKEYGYGR